jgi:hypothetical protein
MKQHSGSHPCKWMIFVTQTMTKRVTQDKKYHVQKWNG